MIVREETDLRRSIASMRDSYLDGRSLAPVADAMDSALTEVLKSEPDHAAVTDLINNPVGDFVVANPAVMDASKPAELRPQLAGDPEQRAPGTALVEEQPEIAKAQDEPLPPTNAAGEITSVPAAERSDVPAPEAQAVLDQQPATVEEAATRAEEAAAEQPASEPDPAIVKEGTAASEPASEQSARDKAQDERLAAIEQQQREERA